MSRTFEIPYPLLRLIAWSVLKPFFRFEIRGLEHLEHIQGRVILAGNHTGMLDSLTIAAACRRYFRFLMTEEVFGWGLIGKLVPYANIIPLYKGREKQALLRAIQELRQEGAICIFPEGKLTENGQLNPFNEGVALLHQKGRAPIVPFAIHGGFSAWPVGRRLPSFRKVILEFAPPILPDEITHRAVLTRTLQNQVNAMLNGLTELPPKASRYSKIRV